MGLVLAHGLHSADDKALVHASLTCIHEAYMVLAACYDLPLVSAALRETVDALYASNTVRACHRTAPESRLCDVTCFPVPAPSPVFRVRLAHTAAPANRGGGDACGF